MAKRYYVVCNGYTLGDWATSNEPLDGKSFDSVRAAFDAAKAGDGEQPEGYVNRFFDGGYYIGSAENADGPFKRELKLTESTRRPASAKPRHVPIKSARSFRRYKAAGYAFEVTSVDNFTHVGGPDTWDSVGGGWIVVPAADVPKYLVPNPQLYVRAVRPD